MGSLAEVGATSVTPIPVSGVSVPVAAAPGSSTIASCAAASEGSARASAAVVSRVAR